MTTTEDQQHPMNPCAAFCAKESFPADGNFRMPRHTRSSVMLQAIQAVLLRDMEQGILDIEQDVFSLFGEVHEGGAVATANGEVMVMPTANANNRYQ